MDRRDFAKSLGVKAGALSALAAAPVGLMASSIPADAKTRDPGLLHLCRAILKQNLLKAGEMMVVATGYIFPEDYVAAMVQAGSEMGALVIHVPVHPKGTENGRLRPGLTGEHWRLYAQADLLIDVSYGRPAGVPAGTSGYGGKIGGAFTHEYPTDRAFIHREGSKTRWLLVHFEPAMQRILFANQARRARAIRGAELLHTANEVRIESEAGSDVTFGARGKQGHCQYGIADVPGRWDPYGTGCVAVAPVKTEAEGVLVFEPGDVLLQMNPQFLPEGEKIKLTFRGGEIVQVDGTRAAGLWDNLIQSYGHPDSLRVAHVGFGIHEATRQFRITRGRRTQGRSTPITTMTRAAFSSRWETTAAMVEAARH